MFCQWSQVRGYWSTCPVLITSLGGRTSGSDVLGLSKSVRKSPKPLPVQKHKHQYSSGVYTHRCRKTPSSMSRKHSGTQKVHLYVDGNVAHTSMHKLSKEGKSICYETLNPSMSLAPDCQGEPSKPE